MNDKLMGWQPIETAPKDGSQFILWAKYAWVAKAGYYSEYHVAEWYGKYMHILRGSTGEGGESWIETDYIKAYWMPLPIPPEDL